MSGDEVRVKTRHVRGLLRVEWRRHLSIWSPLPGSHRHQQRLDSPVGIGSYRALDDPECSADRHTTASMTHQARRMHLW